MPTYAQNISVTDVRNLSNVPSADVSDSQLTVIISGCVAQLNADILVFENDWRVQSIDDWRNNKVDGSNTIYYVPDSMRYIGDYNDDGVLDANDVTAYYIAPSSGTDSVSARTTITTTITDATIGKITLATAPPVTGRLFLTFRYSPLDMSTPHPLIKRALTQLASAMAYSYIDVGKVNQFKVGKVEVLKQSQAYQKYMDDYKRTITQINSRIVSRMDAQLI